MLQSGNLPCLYLRVLLATQARPLKQDTIFYNKSLRSNYTIQITCKGLVRKLIGSKAQSCAWVDNLTASSAQSKGPVTQNQVSKLFSEHISTSTLMRSNPAKPQERAMINITFCCRHISSSFKSEFSCICPAKNTTRLCLHDQNHWNTPESHNEGCKVGNHALNLPLLTNSMSRSSERCKPSASGQDSFSSPSQP